MNFSYKQNQKTAYSSGKLLNIQHAAFAGVRTKLEQQTMLVTWKYRVLKSNENSGAGGKPRVIIT